MDNNEINLYFSYPFVNQKFKEFIVLNKDKFNDNEYQQLMETENYKTLLDLGPDFINNDFNLFLSKFNCALKSKNKKSSSFTIKDSLTENQKEYLQEKKFFFESKRIFHHHLISNEIYQKKFYLKFNENLHTYEETLFEVIEGLPISEIIDNLGSKKAQTSNLILHYQKNGSDYRLLFITDHIRGNGWDKLYKKLAIIFKEQ